MKKLLLLFTLLGYTAVTSAQDVTFTALNGKNWGGDEQIDKLFDGTAKKWCTNSEGAWFTFEASKSVVLTGYAMRTGSDAETTNSDRNPKSWTIYGSDDNNSWEEIDQVEDDNTMDGKAQKTFYFTISENNTSYKYYKFTFEAVHGGNIIQISELIPSYTDYAEVSSLEGIAGGDSWNDNEKWENMVDGNLNNKWSCWPWDDRDYIIVDAGAPIVLKKYMLATGSDTQTNQGRNPTAWTIWGTNTDSPTKDADIWTEVVNVTGQTMPTTNGTPKYFDVAGEPDAYRYYKFKVTDVVEWGMFQLGEIALNPSHSHVQSSYSFAGGGTSQQVNVCNICNQVFANSYTGFTLVDGRPFRVFVNGWGDNGSFTYSRNVNSNIGTICLPYSMNAGSKTDATYYTLAKYDEEKDMLVFDKVVGTLAAFTPALYITTSDAPTTINLNNLGHAAFVVTPSDNVTTNAARDANWSMVGTIKNGTARESGNSIYYLKGGSFHRCNDYITYKPYRAYITGPNVGASVKAFNIWDDTEDALNSVISEQSGEMQLYDLNGRKVKDVRNGQVYILNGRKVMFNK